MVIGLIISNIVLVLALVFQTWRNSQIALSAFGFIKSGSYEEKVRVEALHRQFRNLEKARPVPEEPDPEDVKPEDFMATLRRRGRAVSDEGDVYGLG